MSSPDGDDDFVGVGGPGERFAVLVVFYEIAVDGGLEVDDRMKSAALEATLRQCCEEALDRVESRARGRREVEGETQMAVEPGTHFGLVGGVAEADKLLVAVPLHVLAALPSSTLRAANSVVVPFRL
jgi:hypothetical protein